MTTTREEFLDELDKLSVECMRSYRKYAANFLKIQTSPEYEGERGDLSSKGQLVPFVFNEIQDLVQRIIMDMKARNLLIRLVILKARREGLTTYAQGRYFWHVINKENKHAVTITHEPEATAFLFEQVKRFYNNLPDEFKPETKYNNMKLLQFNTKDGKGFDSAFRVGTAGKGDYGSGTMTHYLLLSELAKYPDYVAADLMTSILQTVPDVPDSEVIFESTAKGAGGEFYDRYQGARYKYEIYVDENGNPQFRFSINKQASEENRFASIFIPWFAFKAYRRPAPEDFEPTTEESSEEALAQFGDESLLMRLHGVNHEQLFWRRTTIMNKCQGSLDIFHQEYPSNETEAFITSGSPVFNVGKIMLLKKNAPEPIAKYDWLSETVGSSWEKRQDGKLWVWEEPVPGRSYIISADPAEGLGGDADPDGPKEGDLSAVQVIDHTTGQQQAEWAGKMDPDTLAYLLVSLAYRYNTAWIVPERNNNGLTTVTTLVNYIKYKKTYVEVVDEPPNRTRRRWGWVTTRGNKQEIVNSVIADMREEDPGIRSTRLLNEMLTFVRHQDGRIGAIKKKTDDIIMAWCIGAFVWDKPSIPRPRLGPMRDDGVVRRNLNQRIEPEGWT